MKQLFFCPNFPAYMCVRVHVCVCVYVCVSDRFVSHATLPPPSKPSVSPPNTSRLPHQSRFTSKEGTLRSGGTCVSGINSNCVCKQFHIGPFYYNSCPVNHHRLRAADDFSWRMCASVIHFHILKKNRMNDRGTSGKGDQVQFNPRMAAVLLFFKIVFQQSGYWREVTLQNGCVDEMAQVVKLYS